MERKSLFSLTGGILFLSTGGFSALAQTPQDPPLPGTPGNYGQQQGPGDLVGGGLGTGGRQPGLGGIAGGGQQPGFGGGGLQAGNDRFGGGGQQPGLGGIGGGQNRFGGGMMGGPMGMMNPMPNVPEMAKKIQTIMVLRQLYAFRLSLRDVEAILPPLKSMRDAEKTLASRTTQILDEEKKGLLAAQPDSPPPPDSGMRIQEASDTFRQQMNRGWETITNAVGPEKAGGIRGLIEGGGMIGGRSFGNPLPQGGRPGQQGQPGNFGSGGGIPGRGQGVPPQPEENGAAAPEPQEPQPGGGLPVGRQGGGQNGFGLPPGRQGRPGDGQNGIALPPGQQGRQLSGQGQMRPNQGMPGMNFGGPQISLTDLVELLEQKQAAMRR